MTDTKPKKLGRWAKKRRSKKENKEPSFRKVGRTKLQDMLKKGLGTSRSKDKNKGRTEDKIYSVNTFKTYKQQFKHYCDWLEKNYSDVHSFEQASEHVNDYLTYLIENNKSASTIATSKAALSKIFALNSIELIATPTRTRADITRSRNSTERDKHISQATEEKFARLTSSWGLRRAEMTRICAEDLFFKNGVPYLNITKGTKGGKSRVAEIVGKTDAETKDIIKWIQSKKGRLVPKLPSCYDNHHYRAEYACRVYQKYARPFDKIPPNERYYMRKERNGEVYDKIAMAIVSKYLGHNRIVVIAQNYLYNVK